MIKLEHVVLANPEQMEFIIEGMRNPMNSGEKSDSGKCGSESLKMIEVGRAAADGIQSGIKAYDTAEYGKEHSGWIEEIKNLVNEFEED